MKITILKMIYLYSSQSKILIGPSRLGQVQIHHELCPQYSELARQQGASAIRQMPALLGYQSNPPPGCLGDTFQ